MSEENVELARQYVETFNKGGVAAGERLWHPDIEMFDPPDLPDAGRYVGKAAIRERIESYIEIGWDGQFRVQEYLDAGEEVVVIWEAMGRSPHGGGLPLDQTFAVIWLFEEGKLRRVRQYMTRAEALEVAGLSE